MTERRIGTALSDSGRRKKRRPAGPMPQRELIVVLSSLIDAAMAKNSTAHRDIARSRLREMLKPEETWWQTAFCFNNISVKRCRYLASMGLPVPMRFQSSFMKSRPGVEKPEVEW